MPPQMRRLHIDDELYEEYEVDNSDTDAPGIEESSSKRLPGLSSLNVFIGPNNAGKSRFLRKMFTQKTDDFLPGSTEFGNVNSLVEELHCSVSDTFEDFCLTSYGKLGIEFRAPETIDGTTALRECLSVVEAVIAQLQKTTSKMVFSDNPGVPIESEIRARMSGLARSFGRRLAPLKRELSGGFTFSKLYIPTLRGLRPLEGPKDLYRNRTRNDYSLSDVPEQHNVSFSELGQRELFTGLEMFDVVREHLCGDLAQRDRIAEYQSFLSREFFDHEQVVIIPRHGMDVLHVRIGSAKEQPIYNLGDGIQQIIILTFPMFVYRDQPLLLYIEEPENYLHPGLLRKLIGALVDTPGERQTFVATHSNHFLDLTLDNDKISVYKLSRELPEGDEREKVPQFRISPSTTADFRLLEELGVRNSSVLLANCTIWVEGITDRWYIRKFLELHDDQFKERYLEDVHYAFVEYGGSNITHWSFLDREEKPINVKRLCGKLFLVCDKDEQREDRHKELREFLDDRLHVLPCLEIENLLTPAVIKSVVESYEDEGVELKEFNQQDYESERLAEFIEDSVRANKTKSKRVRGKSKSSGGKAADVHPYAGKYGQLKDKTGFAKRALAAMESSQDLSPAAIDLAKKIAGFVAGCNP